MVMVVLLSPFWERRKRVGYCAKMWSNTHRRSNKSGDWRYLDSGEWKVESRLRFSLDTIIHPSPHLPALGPASDHLEYLQYDTAYTSGLLQLLSR